MERADTTLNEREYPLAGVPVPFKYQVRAAAPKRQLSVGFPANKRRRCDAAEIAKDSPASAPEDPLEDVAEEADALPLSPVASPPPYKALGGSSDDSALGIQALLSQILTSQELSPMYERNLIFQLLSRLNRQDLSDVSTLISDNLKTDFLSSLPFEIAIKILQNLEFRDTWKCMQVSQTWYQIITKTPLLWSRLLCKENFTIDESLFNLQLKAPLTFKLTAVVSDLNNYYRSMFLENYKVLQNWYNPDYQPKRTTLRGHMTSVVTCLQFEDNYVITGADDKMIRVYNAITKKFLLQLGGHDGGVWALKYDSNGILVSGSTDRTVRIWDIKRGCCTHVFKGHNSTVRCLDIVEYKGIKYIVTGSRDNTLHVWKLPPDGDNSNDWPLIYHTPEENPHFVGILRGHMASVRTVSGHGRIVISGSYDNNLMVWDILKLKCLYILSGHSDRIYSTIYDHKRKRCISASMDSTIKVWDLQNIWNNGPCTFVTSSSTTCSKISGSMSTLQGHTSLVGLLRLSDKFLVSAAADGSLRGWDSSDYSRMFSYHHNNLSAITTFFMNDNILVSGSEGQFNIYNLRTGDLIHSNILRDADQIWSVNFKGRILVAAVEKEGQSFVEILDFGVNFDNTNAISTTRRI